MGGVECVPCSADYDEESDNAPVPPHGGPTIPSAIHSGNAWEPPMPETPLPDIKITVRFVKSQATHDKMTTSTALAEARQLRLISNKQTRKTTPPAASAETFSFRLQSYASTWRLKAAVAELSGCPSKYQIILCDGMDEASCKECNRAATLLSELPAYSEPVPPKPKLKPLTLPTPSNPTGHQSDSEGEPVQLNPVLNMVVLVPAVIPKKSEEAKVETEDAAVVEPTPQENGSSTRTGRMQQGYSDENHSDRSSSARSSGLRPAAEDKKLSPNRNPQQQKLQGTPTQSGTPPQSAETEAEKLVAEKEAANRNLGLAKRVFEEMNIVSLSADLLQVTVGLSNFGYDGLELEQAKKFFKAMGRQISEKITVEHISSFLGKEHYEDPWLVDLRKAILAQM